MIDKLLAGRYRIIEKVGIGGMAVVYKAQDETLNRTVAVKLMLPQYAGDPTFAERFRREAQSAANLQSPYIVSIYDWGQDGDTYYIIMEYVRGVDLKTAIEQRGPVNQRKVAQIGSQVCSALSVAHASNIIHRDIKSQNIMIQTNGDAKVMDFGIAYGGNAHMTQTGSVLGTAHYVSPEQAQGKELTGASDIYSLAIVMYEAITGRVPFEGSDAVSVALRQVNEEPVAPHTYKPDLDRTLEAIILKALAKNPQNRFASADEMRIALNCYLAGQPVVLDGVNVESDDYAAGVAGAALGVAAATTVMNAADGYSNEGATTVMDAAAPQGANGTSVMPAAQVQGQGEYRSTPGDYSTYNNYLQPQEKKKSKKGVIIGIIVAVVVVAAVGVAIGLLTGKSKVPDVCGMTLEEATETLEAADYKVGSVSKATSERYATGMVCSQSPKANKRAKKGTAIGLVISTGSKDGEILVPDLTDMTEKEAKAELTELGLVPKKGEDVESADVKKGRVAAQDPEVGTMLNEGDTVTYHLSKGGTEKTVPDVVGKDQTTAANLLQEEGFTCKVTSVSSSTVPSGYVISQDPAGGTKANTGNPVTITVSSGIPSKVVPSVIGYTEADAVSTLQSAGFGVSVNYTSTEAQSLDGTVASQSPAAGQEAQEGITITISVYTYREA